jgi:ABC-type glutathione transport system ATPase component
VCSRACLAGPEKWLAIAPTVADLILVLKDGELVEQGRYAEVVARGGLFA